MGKSDNIVLCVLCDEQSFAKLYEKMKECDSCERTTVVITQNVKFAEKFAFNRRD